MFKIAYGDVGVDVKRIQLFLKDNHGMDLSPDGRFGPHTRTAVIAYQREKGLQQSGVVDRNTIEALALDEFVIIGQPIAGAEPGPDWPEEPDDLTQPSADLTESLFGHFEFRGRPTADNPEAIQILGDWREDNIVTVKVPELDGALFAEGRGHVVKPIGEVTCHRLAAPKMQLLFATWFDAGLGDRILTFDGAFNARLKRGKREPIRKNLSNHAWGSAFDITADLNPLGHVPKGLGARGCVRELVGIANEMGFYWGGHFSSRPDGMHFELSEL